MTNSDFIHTKEMNVMKNILSNSDVVVKVKKKINWKDVIVRSLKTFIQTFISCIILSVTGMNFFSDVSTSERVIRGLILSALASAVSAVWNSVLSPLLDIDGTPTVKVVYVDRPVSSVETDADIEIDPEDDDISNG